jgi:hypothetical protein
MAALFHYTTGDGLVGIIKNQSLHATHADFLNDHSECRIIKDILTPVFRAELETLFPDLIKAGVIKQEAVDRHGPGLIPNQADEIFKALATTTNDITPFFITSFCQHEPGTPDYEHGLLSQWRAYARGGYALEFDEAELKELRQKEKNTHCYSNIFTEPVVYSDHAKRAAPDKFKGLSKAVVRNALEKSLPANIFSKVLEITGNQELKEFFIPFVSAAPFLKDSGFKEEREYRMVAVYINPPGKNADDHRLPKEIHFRTRSNGLLTPYIDMFANLPDKRLPIKSVMIGPHSNQELQAYAVRALLEQCNLKADVRMSRTPYRD